MKKQEETEESMEECIKRRMSANADLSEEQARAACEEERKPKEPAPTTEQKAFMGKIMGVFNEAIDLKMQDFWKQVEKKMDEAVAKVQDQAVAGLRKGLGIEKDPVIHLSELPEMIRKTMLEIQPDGKRTETIIKDKPTEGAESERKLKSTDKAFEELMKKKGGTF